ncbi:MAG: CDP-alcohol phosphatidyltransferase family protein [Nanoarchaeota archaeon]|nr:CDP-alcohol phosphatidyltransferase family protein [Nanoarchaeota archaeon]
MPEFVNGKRKVWNPLSRYYVEPFGEWIAERLKKTPITPNFVSVVNTILGVLSSWLILLGTPFAVFIFGVWVRFFHAFDITDGHLARVKNIKSKYGGLLDAVGDRLVNGVWPAVIAYTLFIRSNNLIYLYAGLSLLVGLYMYMVTSMKADVYYGVNKGDDTGREAAKSNVLGKVFLFFIDNDIQLHVLTLSALFNRLDIYLFFYAIYFHLVWIAYLGFYTLQHLRAGKNI